MIKIKILVRKKFLPVDETTVEEEDEAGELHEGEFPRPESASQPDPELPGPEASVLGCDVTVERLVWRSSTTDTCHKNVTNIETVMVYFILIEKMQFFQMQNYINVPFKIWSILY